MDHKRNILVNTAKGLAVLVAICLLRYAETFVTVVSFNQVGIVPNIIAMLVLLSGISAIVGLGRGDRWGFIPLYFFIPAITMFFGYSMIPYLPSLVSPDLRPFSIVLLNSSVLVFSVLVLLKMMDDDVVLPVEKC
ncbi:hypothetical protein C9I98_12110 [Photobacterium sanctipauli]|uniref:Uncharacterized protein n=1 Tax=Photobacterium sanctipauli TaxID=1342794 RepID=A0A2T3NTN6_9GAMM|nr:hypothetical protein [Photobacterium sanctipauli]PSW19646.1 hypothetical protein C9I98_12110 [Photobacterium sanctipauli]